METEKQKNLDKSQAAVRARVQKAKALIKEGMTRKDVAKATGLAPQTIVKWLGRTNARYKRKAAPLVPRLARKQHMPAPSSGIGSDIIMVPVSMADILRALASRR